MQKKRNIWIWIGVLFILLAALLAFYNIWDEARAEAMRASVLSQFDAMNIDMEHFKDVYKDFPEKEMPTVEIDAHEYLGVLHIQSLGLELPVIEDFSYQNLRVAPCRYDGSAYQNNLIISAHNYDCHFGRLKSLSIGETLTFTDMDGNLFIYEVVELEVLQASDVEKMKSGEWDLTLFTCTYSGADRVTIRCELIEE